ncbi:hypothetical protein AB0B94_30550 [Micromonospora sp. NPDC048986]|uniref:hypothetical protein n=1 Tax=Micromonospora sp. NPDC048986 TaxID=3155644 RepID=UPI0033E4F50B
MSNLTWQDLKAADPRIVLLERAAVLATMTGSNPDVVYTDAKPFLATLVGWRRGLPALVERPSALQHRFAQAITGTVFGADDELLGSSQAYEVAVVWLYDAVCTAALRRTA